jgi:glucose-6-phosphate isomerase
MNILFLANMDGAVFVEATHDFDPAETLFILSQDLHYPGDDNQCCDRPQMDRRHSRQRSRSRETFVGGSTKAAEVGAFGIDTGKMLNSETGSVAAIRWDSAIGLSTMVAAGPKNYEERPSGFYAMDEYFRAAPPEKNLPMLMGLLAVWYNNFSARRPSASCHGRI